MVRRSEVYLLYTIPVPNPHIIPPIPAAKKMSCSACGRSRRQKPGRSRVEARRTLAGPWAFSRLTRSARCLRRRPIKGVVWAALRGEAAAAGWCSLQRAVS